RSSSPLADPALTPGPSAGPAPRSPALAQRAALILGPRSLGRRSWTLPGPLPRPLDLAPALGPSPDPWALPRPLDLGPSPDLTGPSPWSALSNDVGSDPYGRSRPRNHARRAPPPCIRARADPVRGRPTWNRPKFDHKDRGREHLSIRDDATAAA